MWSSMMKRLCGAQLRRKPGKRCQKPAITGRTRCRLHGGAPGSGVFKIDLAELAKATAAAAASHPHRQNPRPGGLARSESAARGPDGRFLPGKKPKRDKLVTKALSAIRVELMPKKTGSAVAKTQPQKLWDEMSDSEQMTANSRSALAKIKAVLELEINPENARLTRIITNAALQTIATKVRIDEGQFSQHQDRLKAERERAFQRLVEDLPERFRPK